MSLPNCFTGDISFLRFTDILQVLSSIKAEGVLRLNDNYNEEVDVFFKKGEVVNSISKSGFKGEKAFFIPFTWEKGSFSFFQEKSHCEVLIKQNLTRLILEGMRLLDEGKLSRIAREDLRDGEIFELKGSSIDFSGIVDEEFFEPGELIVKEGGYGSWIWVVLDGKVLVEKNCGQVSIPVLKMGEGCFIGNINSFANSNRPRSSTIKAIGRVHLGVLDARFLSKEFSGYSNFIRSYINTIDKRLKKITELYAKLHLTSSEGDFILDKKGLVREKLKPGKLGVIESGKAELYFESGNKFIQMGEIGEGELIGELPFVEKSRDYSFFIAGDSNFAIRPFEKKVLEEDFTKLSDNVKKMIEFSGLCLSVTAYNIANKINSFDI